MAMTVLCEWSVIATVWKPRDFAAFLCHHTNIEVVVRHSIHLQWTKDVQQFELVKDYNSD